MFKNLFVLVIIIGSDNFFVLDTFILDYFPRCITSYILQPRLSNHSDIPGTGFYGVQGNQSFHLRRLPPQFTLKSMNRFFSSGPQTGNDMNNYKPGTIGKNMGGFHTKLDRCVEGSPHLTAPS
jgi:hypothetical protein